MDPEDDFSRGPAKRVSHAHFRTRMGAEVMRLTNWDILKTWAMIESKVRRVPKMRMALNMALNPIDSTRYCEFTHLLKYVKNRGLQFDRVLDVSSPAMLAYVFSDYGLVVKSDINIQEGILVKRSQRLQFLVQDSGRLPFCGGTFDFVYSISVIEHIYCGYTEAVQEMIRVLRPGGFLYLTFPVASNRVEEWLDHEVYSHQDRRCGKTFFQYRFSKADVLALHRACSGTHVVDKGIFWERKAGRYDRVMSMLKKVPRLSVIHPLLLGAINLWAGFYLLDRTPKDFEDEKSFGVLCMILRRL